MREPRGRQSHPRLHRRRPVAPRVRRRPAGTRPSLFALLGEAPGARLETAGPLRPGPRAHRVLVSRERMVVGADPVRVLPRLLQAPLRTGAEAVSSNAPAARGRHAPPPEIRLPQQRERLLRAAASEFATRGYAGATSESISRRAAMSKATFYEHFSNKEDCIAALFEDAAQVVARAIADAARAVGHHNARDRMRAGIRAFLSAVAEYPEYAQTLLVEIIGAGPKAARRRDQVIQGF